MALQKVVVSLFILGLCAPARAEFDPDKWGPLPPKSPQYAPVPNPGVYVPPPDLSFDPYDPQWRQWFAPGRVIPGTHYRELEGSLRTMPELSR